MPQYKAARRIGIYLSMIMDEVSTIALVLDAIARDKQVFVPYIYTVQPPRSNSERPAKIMDMVSVHSFKDYESMNRNRDAWGIPTVQHESVAGRDRVLDDAVGTARKREELNSDSKTRDVRIRASQCDLDMIVMPGLAFDEGGGRLGHGKGFYDIFLQTLSQRYHDDRKLEDEKSAATQSPRKMPYLVGVALKQQVIKEDVPMGPLDWRVDALVTSRCLIECTDANSERLKAGIPKP